MIRSLLLMVGAALMPVAAAAQDWLSLERDLAALYLPTGVVDGEIDQKSIEAIQLFQYSFGYPVKTRLTPEERATLARAARAAQSLNPLVFEETRPSWQSREQMFLGGSFAAFERQIYANGPDFMARRTSATYHPENKDVRESLFTTNTQRVTAYADHARTLVTRDPNDLALSVYVMAQPLRDETGITETLNALHILVPLAEKNPDEPAYVSLLSLGAQRRLAFEESCRDLEEAGRVAELLTRAIVVAGKSGLDPVVWSALVNRALECAPADRRDGLYALHHDNAERVSDYARRAVLVDWARDADARGATDQARQAYADAMALFVVRESGDTDPGAHGMIDPADAVAMQRLGLTAEADRLAGAHASHILTRPPLPSNASRAAMGNHHWAGLQTALMLLDMRKTALLQKLGPQMTPPRAGTDPTVLRGDWFAAQTGLRHLKETEEHSRLVRVGRALLDGIEAATDPKAAMIVNLLVAEAAAELGDFELAENHLTDTQRLAATHNLRPMIEGRVTSVLEKLSVFRLASLPVAEQLLQQLDTFYGTDCKGAPHRKGAREWPFPAVDFAAFSSAPAFRDAILGSDAMDLLTACHKPVSGTRDMPRHEARVFCAVAALNGRSDLVESVLKVKNKSRPDLAAPVWCIYGLTDVGITHWMNRAGYMTKPHDLANLYNLMIAPPPDRQAFLAQFDPETLPKPALNTLPWIDLELTRTLAKRARLLRELRQSFYGSHGQIGPQEEDFRDAHLAAIALQKLGMFNTAEALFYLDDRVEPLGFGNEPPDELAEDLLDIRSVRKRLDYARLYRDAGQYDRARAAIGPLVELAVERLSGTGAPMPGTVEQWSDRLAPAFELYLMLQFDPGGAGPNYHSLFLVQQFIQAAQSTASLSVIEQRLNSSVPGAARAFQDARRIMRAVMRDPNATPAAIDTATETLRAAEAALNQGDAALKSHQIGVIRTLKDATASLGTGEVMLVTTQLDDALIQTVLTGTTAQARRLDLRRHDAISQVRRFRQSIVGSTDAVDRFDLRVARALYDDMLGWALGRQVPRRLRVVADAPWATLPFAALKTGDGWLAQTTALRQSPSVARSVLEAHRSRRRDRPEGPVIPFIGIGDPLLAGYRQRPGVPANARLAPLPETKNELFYMSASYSPTNPVEHVYVGPRATERNLRALNRDQILDRSRIVAMATHGLLSRDAVGIGAAALVLSDPTTGDEDGFLSAAEIYSYRIGADLVILSACNTGATDSASGLSDLASAFFYAGAAGLMLTHWEIDSGAALEMMRFFVPAFDPDSDAPDESLRRAVNGILTDPGLGRFHHPRFWASHFVVT